MGKLLTVNAFLGIFTKIQTTRVSELSAILGQITASLNSIAHFSLDSSECVALILFQNVGRRERWPHAHFTNENTYAFSPFHRPYYEEGRGARIFISAWSTLLHNQGHLPALGWQWYLVTQLTVLARCLSETSPHTRLWHLGASLHRWYFNFSPRQ